MSIPGHYEYIEINPKLLGEYDTDTSETNDDLPGVMMEGIKPQQGKISPSRKSSISEEFSLDDFPASNFATSNESNSTDALLRQILAKMDLILKKL